MGNTEEAQPREQTPTLPVPTAVSSVITGGSSEEAFSAFYRQDYPSLVAFLLWQGAQLADASDIAQETMIVAFQSWNTIEHPKAWTRRVASRRWASKIAGIKEVPVGEPPELPVPLTKEAVTDLEERQEVLRVLRLLPPRQRQILAWTYDKFTPAEIAAELGLTAEAVRASLMKARRAAATHIPISKEGER